MGAVFWIMSEIMVIRNGICCRSDGPTETIAAVFMLSRIGELS